MTNGTNGNERSSKRDDAGKSAAREILEYEKGVNTALKRFYERTHYEATTDQTPLDALLASEEGVLDEWAVKRETAMAVLLWIAADGPHPAALLRRLYLMGDHMMIEPYCLLTLREKGALTDTSHGQPHWLMKRIITDPLMRKGAASVKAPGQKGARASAAAAAAQQGNHNRANGKRRRAQKSRRTGAAGRHSADHQPKKDHEKIR